MIICFTWGKKNLMNSTNIFAIWNMKSINMLVQVEDIKQWLGGIRPSNIGFDVRHKLLKYHLNVSTMGPMFDTYVIRHNGTTDPLPRKHPNSMGGGTHYQVEYSLIMTDPLKWGYKLEGRGRNKGVGWKIGRKIYDRKRKYIA